MSVREVLKEAGLEGSEEVIASAIADSVAALDRLLDADTGWSERDDRLLRSGGLDPAPATPAERDSWMTESAATYARLVATSLSVGQMAVALGVDPSRVRQRITDRTLFGFKVRRQWRLPAWQLANGQELPGLGDVLPHLAIQEPVAVTDFFAIPHVDLVGAGSALSPLQWLLEGRSTGRVAELGSALTDS